jgi:hypothetical protein
MSKTASLGLATNRLRPYAYQLDDGNIMDRNIKQKQALPTASEQQKDLRPDRLAVIGEAYLTLSEEQCANAILAEGIKHLALKEIAHTLQRGEPLRPCDLAFIKAATKVDL